MTVAVILEDFIVGKFQFLKGQFYTVSYDRLPYYGQDSVVVADLVNRCHFELPTSKVAVVSKKALESLIQKGLVIDRFDDCTNV